jgi:hypothetical protein
MPMNLSALLSHSLVAFTIELDNEYEHRTIHRTPLQRLAGEISRGPWLTSFAMYANCLQFLGEAPMSVRDMERMARAATNLDGMRRWGYIQLVPPPEKPNSKRPDKSWFIASTPLGKVAQENWRPLPQLIEQRWRDRFGPTRLSGLRDVLWEINCGLDVAYPDFLPILHYGLFTRRRERGAGPPLPPISEAPLNADSPLTALLSRLLCGFAYDFELVSPISLAISANLLRVLDAGGIRHRDLPQRTGVSKESIAMAMGTLTKANLVETGSNAGKLVRLNASGLAAQRYAQNLLVQVENRWESRFGKLTLQRLRQLLEQFAGDPSLFFQGLKPHPDNWRASIPQSQTLPHFPVVLHRGGYPDGS